MCGTAITNTIFCYRCNKAPGGIDLFFMFTWPVSIPAILGLELDSMISNSKWEIKRSDNRSIIAYKN